MADQKRHCQALSMEPLDADLLRMVKWDRTSASIWFRHIIELTSLYYDRVATREALESDLRRLQQLGWIDGALAGQWVVTSNGEEAVTTARHWTFEIDEVLDERQTTREEVVVGRLTAGSVAFLIRGVFIVSRNGADIWIGHIGGVGATEDSGDFTFVALLTLLGMEDRLQQGDALRMDDPRIG
jgi:hypothetical protein